MAVALAKSLGNGVVVNADASQVYADLTILSARPMPEDMAGIPHRLFGHIDGAKAHNAARWAAEARRTLARAWEDDALPILVGGTGLYLRTLLFGIAPVPDIDPEVRQSVRAMAVDAAHAKLAKHDPEAAHRLHPSDSTRIARALEVVIATGRPLAEWQQQREGGIGDDVAITPLILLPPRDWLRTRCDARLAQMFECGAITEVEALLARRLDPQLPVMRAIGVPQIADYLADRATRAEAIEQAQAATRQYAKRQYTWFRHQLPAEWPVHTESLSVDSIDELAIKLHHRLLTA